MDLKQLLYTIDKVAAKNNISKPYLVGGMVRDIAMKRFKQIKDIDITCGNDQSDDLGQLVLKEFPEATYTKFSDGHGCLHYEDFSVDFSNNFNINNIQKELLKVGLSKPTSMEKELYSRDFTINTLLMPLDLSKIYDLTSKGISDISSKTIDTCLDPSITFLSDPRRIIRVIYLGVKLQFEPSTRVVEWINKNAYIVSKVDKKYMTDRVNKSLETDPKYTFELLKKLNMVKYAPNSELYNDYVTSDPKILYQSLNG